MENKQIKHTKSAGGVVINKDGQILVVSQYGSSWSLPKGHLEKNESESEAAKREIYEESGIKNLKFIKKLGNYERYRLAKDGTEDKSELKSITIFLFQTLEIVLKPIDPQNPAARWVNKEEVAKLLSHPKDKEFCLLIKENI